MSNPIIKPAFESYLQFAYPKGVLDLQRQEVERAFHAGVLAAMTCMSTFSNDLPEEVAGELFEQMFRECRAFSESVLKDWLKSN